MKVLVYGLGTFTDYKILSEKLDKIFHFKKEEDG